MLRPYIICHMTSSSDLKVTGSFLSLTKCEGAIEKYYEINRNYKADAFACGRITMEESFTNGYKPNLSPFKNEKVSREDYIADKNASFFAVSFDRYGNVGWKTSEISDEDPGYDKSHIIEVLLEDTPDENLAYYKSIGVSYIFAGKDKMDIDIALLKLKKLFNIDLLLLEGGSIINTAFNNKGVIDEISLVKADIEAEIDDKPLFERNDLSHFYLEKTIEYNGYTYLNYKKRTV